MYPTNIGEIKDNDPLIVNIQAVIAAAFSGLDPSPSIGIVAWKGVYNHAPTPYIINIGIKKELSANTTEENPPIPNITPDAKRNGLRRWNFRDRNPPASTIRSPHMGKTAVFELPSVNAMPCTS